MIHNPDGLQFQTRRTILHIQPWQVPPTLGKSVLKYRASFLLRKTREYPYQGLAPIHHAKMHLFFLPRTCHC